MRTEIWKCLIVLVFFLACVTGYTAAIQPAGTPSETSNNTPLLFLGNMNIAPVVFLEGTTPKGVDVDIVQALAKHISKPVKIQAMNWSEAQSLVAKGEADALIQINPTEERLKIYDFSDPLLESQFSIFTRSDTLGISGPSSLRGLRVGVESGGLPQKTLEKDPLIQLHIIASFLEGFHQLSAGSLDAVVVDYRVGSYVLAKNNIQNIRVSGEPVASSNSSFAVKKGNTELLNEINNALYIIKTDGTYQKILDNWKPTEGIFQTQEQIAEATYQVGLLILLILFLIAVIWLIAIKIDVTRRKAAEVKLRESEERFRVLFEQATDAILVYDIDRNQFVDANKNAEVLFGTDRDDLITYGPTHFYPPDQPSNLSVDDSIREHNERVMNGETLLFERVIKRKTGEIRYCEVRQVKLPSADKRLIRTSFIDITERKQAEYNLNQYRAHLEDLIYERTQDLQKAKERAEDANKKLNLLSSITRHDIVNELQIIFSSLELTNDETLEPSIRTLIDDALFSAHNIGRQIAFTRDYQDIGVHSPVWQDVNQVITHSIQPIGIAPIQIRIEISGIEIYADPLMEKVFYNLVENAKQYGEKITEIRFFGFEGTHGYTIVCEDDGVGIPDEFKTKIFTREYFKHTGFGLNLSQKILEITGITIKETGESGKGARFEILVPVGGWQYTH